MDLALAQLSFFEAYDLGLVLAGLTVLAIATLLNRFRDVPFSFPILALSLGLVAFTLPTGIAAPDPVRHEGWALHLTELGVIISLMGVGLKIDRRPELRTWASTWRLLAICMPLTIALVALTGWWLVGLAPASALLLGAALAPTDPVLAHDIQVGEPDTEVDPPEEAKSPESPQAAEPDDAREDELRFTLTSEAGLNDALAFPFTYAAILVLDRGLDPRGWVVDWLVLDVVHRLVVGLGVGWFLGALLAKVLLRLPVDTEAERMKAGVGAIAATLLLYGTTELVAGYGFLAVFIGGLTIRHREQAQASHRSLHTVAEQSEQLLMAGITVALGGAIAGGLFSALTWPAVGLGLLVVFVFRPVAGMASLLGSRRLRAPDRLIASTFGVRGIGCLYYLAYGVHSAEFPNEELLWATAGFVVAVSIVVHGVSAGPVMAWRDRRVMAAVG